MNREEYIKACTDKGYKCKDIESVLMFIMPPDDFHDKEKRKEIKRLIKEIDYRGSWGMRPERKNNDSEKLQNEQ